MEKKDINIWDVYVPDKFLTGRPKEYKIMGMEAYHKRYKKFCGRILVDKNGTLLDGYVIYYVAKKNKINKVPVTIVSRMDRFKHFIKGVLGI